MEIKCKSCGTSWQSDDLQKCVWAGIPLCWAKDDGRLICPECYDEMKAAFIASPENFRRWKAEQMALPPA